MNNLEGIKRKRKDESKILQNIEVNTSRKRGGYIVTKGTLKKAQISIEIKFKNPADLKIFRDFYILHKLDLRADIFPLIQRAYFKTFGGEISKKEWRTRFRRVLSVQAAFLYEALSKNNKLPRDVEAVFNDEPVKRYLKDDSDKKAFKTAYLLSWVFGDWMKANPMPQKEADYFNVHNEAFNTTNFHERIVKKGKATAKATPSLINDARDILKFSILKKHPEKRIVIVFLLSSLPK